MSFRERILSRSLKGQSGFTLVEMAIVLVIIGLILSAVTVGKDLQRKADYRKAYTKFISGWKQAYDQFYQDFGYVVGDNPPSSGNAPTGRVGGGAANTSFPNNMTCEARGPERKFINNTYVTNNNRTSTPSLEDEMRRGEIAIPQGTGVGDMRGGGSKTDRGRACQYQYWDSNGIARTMEVSFRYLPAANATPSGLAGNVMVIDGLTPDIAKVFDIAIDGIEEASAGRFRIADGSENWGDINVEGTPTQPTITAFYKMTQ